MSLPVGRFASRLLVATFELRHEKTCFMPYANNKGANQPAHPRSLISAFVVRCLDSIITILAKSTIFRTLVSLCRRGGRFESYQVANHKDIVSRDEAMFSRFSTLPLGASGVMRYLIVALPRDVVIVFLFEPRHDKINKMVVRPAKTSLSA